MAKYTSCSDVAELSLLACLVVMNYPLSPAKAHFCQQFVSPRFPRHGHNHIPKRGLLCVSQPVSGPFVPASNLKPQKQFPTKFIYVAAALKAKMIEQEIKKENNNIKWKEDLKQRLQT